ncbi:glycosyltransferase family 4 protein [Candidatus Sumerlaeota bacterium]|nr:glycosyltransferase family 4 protein [Candidatus Sumerlaeota bacterium]
MRILICSNRYFVSGGPERYLFTVKKILEAHGHTVIPFAMDLERNEPTPYSKHFVPHPVDRRFVYYSDARLGVGQKIRLFVRTLYNREAGVRIGEAIRAEGIDLVYALQVGNYLSPAMFHGAFRMNVPVVARQSDYHLLCPAYHFLRDGMPCEDCRRGLHHAIRHRCLKGSIPVSAARVMGMWIERFLGTYDKVDCLVAPSRFLRDKLIEYGYAADRVVYMPNPVDVEAIEPSYVESGYLLYAGNLNRQKGVRLLVEAMADHRNLRLKVAGKGSEEGFEEEIRAVARSGGLENVEFVGFRSDEELRDLYRGALAFVMPAVWYENTPNAVIEAMAFGKPIVASRIGSMTELVEDGANGLLIEPGDARALSGAIGRLAADGARAARMGRRSREMVERDHGLEDHYSRLNSLFESCMKRRH